MSNIIVMAFSPRNIVGCFLKKKAYKGGGHRHPRTPPHYALVLHLTSGKTIIHCSNFYFFIFLSGIQFFMDFPLVTDYTSDKQ